MTTKRAKWIFAALGGSAGLAAILLSWTALAVQFDNNVYDFLHRLAPVERRDVEAVLVTFDDRTLMETGGLRNIRKTLARALESMAAAPPSVVAIDLTLADTGVPAEDAALAAAFAKLPRLVLACEMVGDGSGWQDPDPTLRGKAQLGHVHALPGPLDDVNRSITLERVVGRTRRWALSVQAFRLFADVGEVVESPSDIWLGGLRIRSRQDEGRPMLVRYRLSSTVETVPARRLLSDPTAGESLAGRVVFIGVTSLSAVKDRLFTPLSPLNQNRPSAGVEIHAQAFETLASGRIMQPAGDAIPLLLSLLAAGAMASFFAFLRTRWAYSAGLVLLILIHLAPWLLFRRDVVIAPFGPVAAAWLGLIGCASFRFFVVRRQLETAEAATERYQQAFRFVAHEMRTPLTAIQGSSEIISRYNLTDEKRKQIGLMINAESKRLAQMITTFLDVERVGAGRMDLRLVEMEAETLVRACVDRAQPLAERKSIIVETEGEPGLCVRADRELMEFALYNLVTNAIKYSPSGSRVRVTSRGMNGRVLLSVRDQGMGMTPDEQKRLFQKFYRTPAAEKAGIQGTGIGLTIVKEIVALHGGRVSVESAPEQGSTFTVEVSDCGLTAA